MHVIILIIHLLLNVSDIFFSLSSEKWYVLPVSVSGVSILHRICVLCEDLKCEINFKIENIMKDWYFLRFTL